MTTFERAIADLFDHEGGYVNDPADPGGETKYGISKRSYPNEDIARLTKERATEIYRRDWWIPLHCGELYPPVACKLLDVAVNLGKRRAVMMLQDACGTDVNGKMGPFTVRAANQSDPKRVVGAMCEAQRKHYESLILQNPRLAKFAAGWSRRAAYVPKFGA